MPPGKRCFKPPIVPIGQPDAIQPPASEHSTIDTAGSSTSSTASKRVRGRTKGKDLDRLNYSTGSNMIIEIPKDKGRPVDYEQSAKLSNELGIIARNLIPVPTKWKNISEEDKEYAFERLKRDKVTGIEQDRIDFYESTHWNRDKGWTCRGAEENHREMVRLRSLVDSEGNPMMTADEIVDQVLGVKSGYIRGLGHGPKPKTSKLAQQRAENQILLARIEALEEARAAEAEAHRVEKEATLAREAKVDKLFDMLLTSGILPPTFFTSGAD